MLQGHLTPVASVFYETVGQVQPWLSKPEYRQYFKQAWKRDVCYGSSSAALTLQQLERLRLDRCFLRFLEYSPGHLAKQYALARSFIMIQGEGAYT